MPDPTPAPDAFQQATLSQLTGVLKLLLTAAGATLVQKGLIDQNSMVELASGVAALMVALLWMLWARRLTGVLKSASAALGNQGVIIAPPAIADKLPNNVVGSVEAAGRLPGIQRTDAPAPKP